MEDSRKNICVNLSFQPDFNISVFGKHAVFEKDREASLHSFSNFLKWVSFAVYLMSKVNIVVNALYPLFSDFNILFFGVSGIVYLHPLGFLEVPALFKHQ